MANDVADDAGPPASGRSPSRHARRWALIAGAGVTALIAVAAMILLALNTAPGRAFLVSRLAGYTAASGLNVNIGRIDGSLYGRMTLSRVTVSDPQGLFAIVPEATLDWRPLALLRKTVDLRELNVPSARLLRRPGFKATPRDPNASLLPDIAVIAPNVQIERIVFEPAVTGRRHAGRFNGVFNLADGRARIDMRARALSGPGLSGGDRLDAVIDIAPKLNRLRVALDLDAPADGLVDSYLHLGKPLIVAINGRGDWQAWNGRALAKLGAIPVLELALDARDGHFGVEGQVRPARLVTGSAASLFEPEVSIDAQGALARRRLDGKLALTSDALSVHASGAVALDSNRFERVQIDASLLRPATLAKNLTGRDVKLSLALDGRLSNLRADYDLTATSVGVGDIQVRALHATGRARLSPNRIKIPVKVVAARVTGLNAAAGGSLSNIVLSGDLAYDAGRWLSDNLRLRSDRINATAVIVADPGAGQYAGALKGRVNDYALAGLGRFDLVTDAKLITGPKGGFGLRGAARVTSRRLDNKPLRELLGGQGVLSAKLELHPGGALSVTDLRLKAPDFQIDSGGGDYQPNGALTFQAAARSRRYGPLTFKADGTAQRPVLRLAAAAPDLGVPLRDVVIDAVGGQDGYRVSLRGSSPYGPFSGNGVFRAKPSPSIEIATFTTTGVTLSGTVSQGPAGPFAGTLRIAGSGLSGAARLSAAGSLQRADLDLRADQARLALAPVVTIGSGRVTAAILLTPKGPEVSGQATVTDLARDGLVLTSAQARGRYQSGQGQLGLVAKGRNAVPFDLAAQASLTPQAIRANLTGTINRLAVRLAAPAQIDKVGPDWRLSPVRVQLAQGEAILSGRTGETPQLNAQLRQLDLGFAQSLYPKLALEGTVNGVIEARQAGPNAAPVITARVDVEDFSRVGLATASPPVDVALRGNLGNDGGDVEALVKRGGATIGRLRARLGAPARVGALGERLSAAALSGGIRYNGPADVIWAMTGIAGHDVSGPIAVAADFGGKLGQPTLSGVIRADALRYANPTYGTAISNIALHGHFTQSRLEIDRLSGRAGAGTITARGWVGLDAAAGFPLELRATLDRAQLAGSDALDASVSGTLSVTNNRARGALVEGELSIPEARYQIVRQGSAEVAVLEGVRRGGSPAPSTALVAAKAAPVTGLPDTWKLNIKIRADNRIYVSGMGLESEWGADLRVVGTASAPSVTGRLDLVRGTYAFAGRRLEISKAQVRFDGRQATNPLIEIAASTTVEGVTATVNVSGRAQDPQIAFTSTPALPQDEVLSRLLFGSSVGQLSPTQAIQVAAALNSLRTGGGGLNPLGKLRAVAGVDRLRVLGADAASGRGTALAAGAYLGRHVYIEVITDARGFTATQLEIALSRTLSLLTQTASFGGSSVQLKYSKDY